MLVDVSTIGAKGDAARSANLSAMRATNVTKQTRRSTCVRASVCVAVCLLFACTPKGAPSAFVLPSAPPSAAAFDVGSLHVDAYGTPDKPVLVFVPGLACGPWAWYGTIARFAPKYTIYAITLPGFDGTKHVSGPLFATVAADFWKFLRVRRVAKPVVIGHSLGGTLALMLAEQHPDRLRAVISVDGLPIFPGFDAMTPARRAQIGAQAAVSLLHLGAQQFEQYEEQQALPPLVGTTSAIPLLARLTAKSDPAAVGAWLKEDFLLDLRPDLPKITIPVLEIAPFDVAVDGRYGAITAAQKQRYYLSLLRGTPNVTVAVIEHSHHFVMVDRPQQLNDAIASFLAAPSL